jgi:hypothetical protein
MKKAYMMPECKAIFLQTNAMMAVSDLGLQKTEKEADENYEVLSREHNDGSVWNGKW